MNEDYYEEFDNMTFEVDEDAELDAFLELIAQMVLWKWFLIFKI